MKSIIAYILLAALVVVAGIAFGAWWNSPAVVPQNSQVSSSNNNYTQTPMNLEITDLVAGMGAEAKAGDKVTVHYTGTLADGTVFDSSKTRGTPFTFTLGVGQVIKGWDEGFAGMKIGGTRKLVIPPGLAYGAQQVGPIPPNSTLTFEVELLEVN
ncbi:MAG: FKBP-type peptidyl-prolyl cis-trans isomerase [Patescibacteria group bacterium]|nr:FKBP-type peptidyl-prolyl cis-trans isomerase [Patescibacteria group bacterium]